MKSLAFALLLALSPLTVDGAPAQEKKKQTPPCDDAGSQFEMNQCADKEYRAADAELNAVYQRLAAKLDVESRARLKTVETAWLKYRDANCEYESSFYRGGTMRPMIHAFCLARVTGARTEELKGQIEELEQFE
jgi:uncharacterized protein YecT (DUF1311 family)